MQFTILILNVIGTFLLSAEAIKVENLRIPAKVFDKGSARLNPQIEFVEENTNKTINTKSDSHIYHSPLFLPWLTILAMGIVSFFLIQHYLSDISLFFKIIMAFFGGLIIWTIMIYSFKGIVIFLSIIEKKLSKGTIGIIGFILLLSSFVLQYILKDTSN
jgi:hypothetical protein